jgi:hypothetical protein
LPEDARSGELPLVIGGIVITLLPSAFENLMIFIRNYAQARWAPRTVKITLQSKKGSAVFDIPISGNQKEIDAAIAKVKKIITYLDLRDTDSKKKSKK